MTKCHQNVCMYGIVVMVLWCAIVPVQCTPISQVQCKYPENPLKFKYPCIQSENEEDQMVDLCIKGRHLKIPKENCEAGVVDHDEICVPCDDGTFMDVNNFCDCCQPHTVCRPDEVQISKPSASKDRKCGPRNETDFVTPAATPSSSNRTDDLQSNWTTSSPPVPSDDQPINPSGKGEVPWLFITVLLGILCLSAIVVAIICGCCLWKKCKKTERQRKDEEMSMNRIDSNGAIQRPHNNNEDGFE